MFVSGANYRWQTTEEVIPTFRPTLEGNTTSMHFYFHIMEENETKQKKD